MEIQQQDDRLQYDAPLACLLFGWEWYYVPSWDWVGLWPPDTPEWVRWNFPDDAQKVDGPGEHKLMPSWFVGGYPAGQKEKTGLPRFSSDWNAMSLAIDEMRKRGYWWNGSNFCTADRPAYASFATRTADWSNQAETLPRATAIAALRALEEREAVAIVGEVSTETVRGRLTSIRNVAGRVADEIYERWLLAHNAGDTDAARHAFIHETANAALAALP